MPNTKEKFFSEEIGKKLETRISLPEGIPKIEYLPTGLLSLDYAIGGGLPKGRVTEIAGLNATGKTTTALIIAQRVIENGGYVAWFEAEEALDTLWMTRLGIPPEQIYMEETDSLVEKHFHIFHPPYLEKGLENIRLLAKDNMYDLVVYDSIGGSPTIAMYEADIEDQQMAVLARVLSRFCAVLPQEIKKTKAAYLFTNQVSSKMGNVTLNKLFPYGGTKVAKGGEGMAFLSTVRIMTYDASADVNPSGEIIGKIHKGRIYKNKTLGGKQREFTFSIKFDPYPYIDYPQDLAEMAGTLGVVERRGRFWYYGGAQVAGSIKEFKEYILNKEGFAGELDGLIRQAIKDGREGVEIEQAPRLLDSTGS